MSDLHAKIMNLECNEPDLNRTSVAPAYRLGHRDARHAAAELAAMEAHRIEAQAAAIDAALAELDASPIMNAHICEAKRILRAAREVAK